MAREYPERAVIIRSGGLGDFVLTLPWLRALGLRHLHRMLITRRAYWRLVSGEGFAEAFLDVDGPDVASLFGEPLLPMRRLLEGASVYSFLPDPEGVLYRTCQTSGAASLTYLNSRPGAPPHVTTRMFLDSDLAAPPGLINGAVLAPSVARRAGALWIHPGSGNPAKNPPLEWLRECADNWLHDGGQQLYLSLGEAEDAQEQTIQAYFGGLPVVYVRHPSLNELRQRLTEEASEYLGPDSGVSHLAAAVGLPTNVVFRVTDPQVWAPLGPHVRVISMAPG